MDIVSLNSDLMESPNNFCLQDMKSPTLSITQKLGRLWSSLFSFWMCFNWFHPSVPCRHVRCQQLINTEDGAFSAEFDFRHAWNAVRIICQQIWKREGAHTFIVFVVVADESYTYTMLVLIRYCADLICELHQQMVAAQYLHAGYCSDLL